MNVADPALTAQCQAEINSIKRTDIEHDFRVGSWGHRCCFDKRINERTVKFYGWATPQPSPGDTFLRIGSGGYALRYFVAEARPAHGPGWETTPWDMFYLTAICIGRAD